MLRGTKLRCERDELPRTYKRIVRTVLTKLGKPKGLDTFVFDLAYPDEIIFGLNSPGESRITPEERAKEIDRIAFEYACIRGSTDELTSEHREVYYMIRLETASKEEYLDAEDLRAILERVDEAYPQGFTREMRGLK